MIKGQEVDIEKYFEKDVPQSFKFYDRDMILAAKYLYAKKIQEAKKKIYVFHGNNIDQGGPASVMTTQGLPSRN